MGAWIEQNDLNDIKHLFQNQNMCTLSSLSMQSSQFPLLITAVSALSDGNNYIQKIVKALQSVTHNNKKRIIATEQEIGVEESIKHKLKQWSFMNQRIDQIQQQFVLRKNKKMSIEQQINSNFQTISTDTKQ